jgi:GT2 family glycosyltransferase|tara:strand:- start:41501 stop:42286 length:786 start_codon:yes stop_codon:yes gene_type:complete
MKDITVIIPIHTNENKELKMLETALGSVNDQKTQPEMIYVVCPKKLEKEIKKLDFGKLNNKIIVNEGDTDFASQINLGVEKTSTEFFCVLEVDDELSSIWIKNVKEYMNHYEEVDVFLPLITNVDDKNKFIGWSNEPVWALNFSEEIGHLDLDALLNYPNFNTDGMVMRTEMFNDIGGFKKNIKLTFIYEFLLRSVFMDARIMTIPKIGYKHVNMREGSLFYNYKNHPDFLVNGEDAPFWMETAKKEYFFTEDREIEVKKL